MLLLITISILVNNKKKMEVNNKTSNIINFKDLPMEILLIIKEYSGDFNNLLNTTKAFAVLKKDLLQWFLNKEYSLKFIFNERFYNKFISEIKTKKQVYLNLSGNPRLKSIIEIIGLEKINLNIITGINKLKLDSSTDIQYFINIFSFEDITSLDSSSNDIIDVSKFKNINILNLSNCRYITNVSTLGCVTKLNLHNCNGITDVTELINVHELNLSDCKNITNVNNLINVKKLNLRGCDGLTDVSNLGNVHVLDLSRCENITNVSNLGNVKKLSLSECDEIINVSDLGNVHELDLSWCNNITNISCLGNVKKLYLRGCDGITDVSNLGNVHELDLRACNNITNVSALVNIKKLILKYT